MTDNAVAHHPLTVTQPVPEQCQPPHQLPQLYSSAGHHLVQDIPLGSLGQLSWLRSLLAPSTPQLLAGRAASEAETSLALCKHHSAPTNTSLCYRCCSHPKFRTQHPTSGEEESCPRQNQDRCSNQKIRKYHWPCLLWPSEQVDCGAIFGQVTLK